MKTLIVTTLILLGLAGVAFPQSERTFNSIVVRDEAPGWRNIIVVDYDCDFAWVGRHFGDQRDFGGNTTPGVFIHSKAHNHWLQILRVSTAGAKFGKAPEDARLQMGWDFTKLASKQFVPLPLSYGSLDFPDKIVYDDTHGTYVLYFDTWARKESVTTTLLIPKKDLVEAFEYYARHKYRVLDIGRTTH
jgi:hypothetical protein